jgi:hypothetical protein
LLVGGVGVLGAIGAAVTGGMLVANNAEIDERCPNRACDAEGLAMVQQSKDLVIGNYVSWAVAIAGVGGGAALLIADAVVEPTTEAPVAASALIVPGGAFVGIHGRF